MKEYLASQFYGTAKNDALGMFLLEVRADPQNPYNYEPLYMAELQRQRPQQLFAAQFKYATQIYLGCREKWWEARYGFKR